MEDRLDITPLDITPTDATPTDITPTVIAMQRAMSQMDQYVPETRHYFADGMYCREVFRHAGVCIVGKVHRREHFYMVVQGAVAVVQDGAERKVYRAPAVIVSKPGTKRAVVALEDSTCLTVHRTDKTDFAEIEAELIEPDDTALFDAHNRLKALEHQQ